MGRASATETHTLSWRELGKQFDVAALGEESRRDGRGDHEGGSDGPDQHANAAARVMERRLIRSRFSCDSSSRYGCARGPAVDRGPESRLDRRSLYMMRTSVRLLATVAVVVALVGCATTQLAPIPRGLPAEASSLDLSRFMGDWYVLAHIPTRPERNSYDALEQYTLRDDGRIDIRFSFCEGSADGPRKTLEMLAWVHDTATNAEWRVRPFWPLSFDYQVLELSPDYSLTVIGHPSRRYAWIMARTPEIDAETLDGITQRLAALGFETQRLRRVPHSGGGCPVPASAE